MGISVWRLSPGSHLKEIQVDERIGSLNSATKALPQGAYTTFRTYGKYRVLHLADHLARLEESARLSGQPVQIDWEQVRAGLRQAIANFPGEEARIRLTVDLSDHIGDLYVGMEPLKTPSAQNYAEGVKVITQRMHRRNPRAKLTPFVATASAVRQTVPPDLEEVLMVGEDNRVLEGLSSNFFALYQGWIWTAEEGILPGITRSIVLKEIANEKLRIRFEGLPIVALPELSEAFITSSSRAVLPVVKIDAFQIGDGKPGAVSARLLEDFLRQVEAEIELV